FENLKDILPNQVSKNESDFRHIAHAITDNTVKFFLTLDENILKLADTISQNFQISIIRPVDIILYLDELYKIEEYQNMQIAGTSIKRRRLKTGETEGIADFFQNIDTEKKNEFLKFVRDYVVDTEYNSCFIIEDKNQNPLCLIAYDRSNPNQLSIPVLRLNRSNLDVRLLRFLLLEIIIISANEHRNTIIISDPHLQDDVKKALQSETFIQVNNQWYKITLPFSQSASDVADYLGNMLKQAQQLAPYYQLHIGVLKNPESLNNIAAMSELERIFYPLKILDSKIQTITIPIKPVWASSWFDSILARGTVFGASDTKAFNRESVYYSKAKPLNISLPARVVWYVTKKQGVPESQYLRACSRLDDIVVGTAKELYRQFRSLGIYEWDDLISNSKDNSDQVITAYRFSDTYLFNEPVSYEE
ncbi:MAG TPA: hypothetical protein PLZ51_00140, partial [Aggregatilineales bacterium]|nr:hypothetical protein [Aggregatilineales bacterium]